MEDTRHVGIELPKGARVVIERDDDLDFEPPDDDEPEETEPHDKPDPADRRRPR